MRRLTEIYRVLRHQPLDTRLGTAGSCARVFSADSYQLGMTVAIKVLKAEHVGKDEWYFKSLLNEAYLLNLLADDKNVVNLYDCGYILSDDPEPTDGDVVSFELDTARFLATGSKFIEEGWRPYLALEMMPPENNVPMLISQGRRARIPREEAIELSRQHVALLSRIHARHIMYRDFKLEHTYWDGMHLVVIDWNASAQTNPTTSVNEQPVEIHKFVTAVMYPIFTLQTPLGDGLYRSQARDPRENEAYLRSVRELHWGPHNIATPKLKEAMSRAIVNGSDAYTTAVAFEHDLKASATELGWPLGEIKLDAPSAKSHAHIMTALSHLRLGQIHLNNAKESLEDVLGLTQDDEVNRLYRDICEFLSERVIP